MAKSPATKAGSDNSEEKDQETPAERWIKELTQAEKELRKFWERGRKVVKIYNASNDEDSELANPHRYNVFWSNVGVWKASLYANPPKPLVKREFDDYQDDVARVAGIMMERLLQQGVKEPESDMNVAFKQTVEDRLIPGMGQVWLRYVPTIKKYEVEPAKTDLLGKAVEAVFAEEITNEIVATDYIYWEDFWWSPARTWAEVRWVSKRVYLTKPEFKKTFTGISVEKVSWVKKIPTKYGDRVVPDDIGVEKVEIFEIWDKVDRKVIWVCRSYEDDILKSVDDPLQLEGFFPCPPPLFATKTTSNLVPKSDYMMVQTQYRRLETLSIRIGMLEDAIQASGCYDKTNAELGQFLPNNGINKMIPVDNWAAFAEKGGIKGQVDWFPLDMIAQALDKLRQLFQDARMELYELTGISDIMRGVTAPRETATAQGLKAQYSSVRLQFLQGEVANFVQNGLKIKAEIISKHFQPETIIKNSLIEYTPDGEMAVEAAQLLKDEWASCYRIEVHADQMAIPDYNAERQGRTEFIGAVGQFISQTWPLIQAEPGAAPFLLQILQWGIASFRSAQTIEGIFDKAAFAVVQKLQQAAQQPPQKSPEQQVAEAEIMREDAVAKAGIARDNAETQNKIQSDRVVVANDIQLKRAKTRVDIEETRRKNAAKIAEAKKQPKKAA